MPGDPLAAVLERSRELGFLGPGPIEAHVANAGAFADAFDRVVGGEPASAVDLGSGGGVPGLALALRWPASSWVLLDAMHRRCEFLREAIVELGLADRVLVLEARAEDVGRNADHRGQHDLVTARSFGAAAVTAECAAPLLTSGGHLLVSEPPEAGERWSREGLGAVGLVDRGLQSGGLSHIRVLELVAPTADRYPRRTGVPAKRPLW